MAFKFIDNSSEVLAALLQKEQIALEKCGLVGEGYAKALQLPRTGNLRNSITHEVVGDSVKIGTPVEYGVYVEFGTGIFVGGGRPTPWVYQDGNGNWHRTSGQRPKPFIKPAVADHADEYKRIIKETLKE